MIGDEQAERLVMKGIVLIQVRTDVCDAAFGEKRDGLERLKEIQSELMREDVEEEVGKACRAHISELG